MQSWVITMWMVCFYVAFADKLPRAAYMRKSLNVFCNSSVLRETTTDSELVCAGKCRSDAQCVAYSRRGSQCVLHDGFCSSLDLLPEAGARYAEVQWECFGSSRYYMPTLLTRLTKADADAECEAMGAHVLAVETAEENNIVTELVFHSSYGPASARVWIDLVDHITWQYSGQAVTFANWADGHPDKQAHYKCTALYADGAWDARSCSRAKSFVCEK